ncbi:hypothetical protein UFOVP116_303 [uncultured Caudovirales phage]|uniref:Uncharacterized protein n=1 Tax=uncultured Caudovirales phage TaxID=2100421 RepID=A0A6J5LAW1_9CAUD|nr:hypothetical protein UFOVP116_303 [uncultured Caudovirales phage]
MYKKISHNIVEEHYATSQMPRSSYKAKPVENETLCIDSELPDYVMNENSLNFRMDARSLWAKYTWGLLNYGISLNGMLPSTDLVEARVIKNAIAIGDFITPYYGVSAGSRVSKLLAGIGQIGIDVVKATKEQEPLDNLLSMWDTMIEQLSKLLNELNPNNWPESLMCDYLKNLVKCWTNQIVARDSGDEVADEAAVEQLYKIVVIGITNSVPSHKISSLSDAFSRGIIAQFPTLFAE